MLSRKHGSVATADRIVETSADGEKQSRGGAVSPESSQLLLPLEERSAAFASRWPLLRAEAARPARGRAILTIALAFRPVLPRATAPARVGDGPPAPAQDECSATSAIMRSVTRSTTTLATEAASPVPPPDCWCRFNRALAGVCTRLGEGDPT